MPAQVHVCHKWYRVPNQHQRGTVVIDTTSRGGWTADLSPFSIGPCPLYDGHVAQNVENAWQYAKVYAQHTDENGNPTVAYWQWAYEGWTNPRPVRYPMGKGARPQYSLWEGERLGYIDARKRIYGPLYAEAVQRTQGWQILLEEYEKADNLWLRDWDGWLMERHGMTSLTDVLNNPGRIMGHAFVLQMLLTDDPALQQMTLRI